MRRIETSLLLLALLALGMCGALRAPPNQFRKKLAGPPSEFPLYVIPNPLNAAVTSSSALQPIEITESQGQWKWEGSVAVDSDTQFTLALFHPHEDYFHVLVTDRTVAEPVKRVGPFGIDGAVVPVTTWTWYKPTPGVWTIQLVSRVPLSVHERNAIIAFENESPIKAITHLSTYDLQLGQEVGLVASIYDATANVAKAGERPTPLALPYGAVVAEMEVTFPDGKEVFIPMHDDGLHGDLAPGDGIYGAYIQAHEVGDYTSQAIIKGTLPSGVPFYRTTEHLFSIIEPSLTLTGLAFAEYNSAQRTVYFHIDIDMLHPVPEGLTVKTYAEVWATREANQFEYVPVAWLQAMVDPETLPNGAKVLTLQMNEDWLHLAQATAPFQLRNVWIEERDTNIPFSSREKVYVESNMRSFKVDPLRKHAPITRLMREGPRPAALANVTSALAPNLMLVHGYCAGSNEFPTSQFSNSVQFQDYKQTRSNDAFAVKLNDFATAQGMSSFSVVGHSQAGLASTHLHTYYFSGLENAKGGRLIQSVGSPYLGTPLAGTLAGVGPIFGIGCGRNYDLTTDGASLWAGAIPANMRKDVTYYLTQYGSAGYCVFGANMFLAKPNDGTTEISRGQFSGANNAGTKSSWCHTNGMTSPAQCTDAARNQEMNSLAAR